MKRTTCWLVAALTLGMGGLTFAHLHGNEQEDGELVKELWTQKINEKIDGQAATVTAVEVTIEPGKSGLPHRHPGPAFVYVLEGTYELGIDDEPVKVFRAGETFYEPAGHLHRVSRNPASEGRTRLIAFVVHPRDARHLAVPEPAGK